jgi:2-C-methyl-D-erythritol 2,4-cyclodiphosphate synthase
MVGFGFDVHRLEKGESLILGGVEIISEFGTVAHSDGDVLLHAVMDSILGAVGMGDIGEHFPDTSHKYKGVSSLGLLEEVINMIESKYRIGNLDIMVVLEEPKLKQYKDLMKHNISKVCGISLDRVNIKATTNEKLGYIGRGEGIAVYSICEVFNI